MAKMFPPTTNFVAEEDKEDEEDHRLQFRTARSARRRGSW